MSERSQKMALSVFHYTLGIVVFILSFETVAHVVNHWPLEFHSLLTAAIAGTEALAALLFMFPPGLRTGGYLLIAIFAFAFCFHGLQGYFEFPLLIYAAGVFLVLEQKKRE